MSALAEAAYAYARTGPVPRSGNMRAFQARAFANLNTAALVFAKTSDEQWAAEVAELKRLLQDIYDASNGDGEWKCNYPDLAERLEKLLELEG